MPREVKAYACKWDCHRHCITSRKRMEKHEAICNWNPANRACITCAHFIPGVNSRDHEDPGEPAGCEQGEDIGQKLRNECPLWAAGGGGEMCVASGEKQPNDPKLSDGGGWRDGCAGEGGGAASVTAGAVRCSAWLGHCAA